MYQIHCNKTEPYGEAISAFIKREFPVLVKPNDAALLDLLTDAIIASGQVRLGPKPSPESLVAIREVISYWTAKGEPIPFLVGWGSEKPDGSGVDVAELFALKTLSCLNARVKTYYPQGAAFNIRVEDASAPHLFFDRMEAARREAAHYTAGFVNLSKVLGVSSFVHVRPESSMISEDTFNHEADKILPAMEAHVINPDDVAIRSHLLSFGWKVPLSSETIGYYTDRYAKLYPDLTDAQQKHLLARYFAGALARHSLGITGIDKAWQGKFLELSFVQPTPGIGAERAKRRLYYRTMPCSITSNHMSAWRAKGYLKVGAEVTASLTSFSNKELQFNPNMITLSGEGITQNVQADYIVL